MGAKDPANSQFQFAELFSLFARGGLCCGSHGEIPTESRRRRAHRDGKTQRNRRKSVAPNRRRRSRRKLARLDNRRCLEEGGEESYPRTPCASKGCDQAMTRQPWVTRFLLSKDN